MICNEIKNLLNVKLMIYFFKNVDFIVSATKYSKSDSIFTHSSTITLYSSSFSTGRCHNLSMYRV